MKYLHAIQTEYRGIKYRSRTEARWAVFFHEAAIQADYEPLGVVVGGKPYLPDFYLPEMQVWFEVKGDAPTAEELQKAQDLERESGKQVLIAQRPPSYDGKVILTSDGVWGGMIHRCRECIGNWLVLGEGREPTSWAHMHPKDIPGCLGDMSMRPYEEAVRKAQAERFGVFD